MLVLTGTDFPDSTATLAAAVNGGLAMFFKLPPGGQAVNLTGEYPHLSSALINLTGADASADSVPPDPRGVGTIAPGFDVGRVSVVGSPMRLRGNPMTLSATADNVAFDYDRDAAGRPVLVPRQATNGQFSASITKVDLEALILSGAREGAGAHGISIIDAHLDWSQLDARSVGLAVAVTARKIVKAQITVIGRLTIDQAMNAQLTNLECSGTGMISTLACGAIRPKLHQIEGKTLNLNTFLTGIKLRDVQISVGQTLVVQGSFGS